jgi:hypothetical protein
VGQQLTRLWLFVCIAIPLSISFGGSESPRGKEMQPRTTRPCAEWYADIEWNFGLGATYVFTANEWRDDHYIEDDHAWSGGLDAKYFFNRYVGLGIEGWAADTRREFIEASGVEVFESRIVHENRAIGAIVGTLTLRYPIHSSRFSPYLFAGSGAIFGGGERERYHERLQPLPVLSTEHLGSTIEALGQFGGGFEVRLTPHVGWVNDFSWNVVSSRDNNFGMFRSGINFAF